MLWAISPASAGSSSTRTGVMRLFLALLWLGRTVVAASLDCNKVLVKDGSSELTYNLSTIDREGGTRPWTFVRPVEGEGKEESISVNLCTALPGTDTAATLVAGVREKTVTRYALREQPDDYPKLSVGSGLTDKAGEKPFDLELKGEGGQSTRMTFICSAGTTTSQGPSLLAYNGEILHLSWRTPLACQRRDGGDGGGGGGGGDKDGSPGVEPGQPDAPPSTFSSLFSFLWSFFLLALFGLALYFAIGIWHNWSQYGARGSDLLPHRDFWTEVPYLVRDLGAKCFGRGQASVSNRNGYQAV